LTRPENDGLRRCVCCLEKFARISCEIKKRFSDLLCDANRNEAPAARCDERSQELVEPPGAVAAQGSPQAPEQVKNYDCVRSCVGEGWNSITEADLGAIGAANGNRRERTGVSGHDNTAVAMAVCLQKRCQTEAMCLFLYLLLFLAGYR
jgi:hypothetical protein